MLKLNSNQVLINYISWLLKSKEAPDTQDLTWQLARLWCSSTEHQQFQNILIKDKTHQ